MKVLSLSSKSEKDEMQNAHSQSATRQSHMKPSARKALLKAFGVRLEDQPAMPPLSEVGMEDDVLNRMEGKDLGSQMKEFYTAYSKVSHHTFHLLAPLPTSSPPCSRELLTDLPFVFPTVSRSPRQHMDN